MSRCRNVKSHRRTRLSKAVVKSKDLEDTSPPPPIIVDLSRVVEMDYTAAAAIRALAKQMKKSGQAIYFCEVREDIEAILQGADSSLFVAYVNVADAEQKIRAS
jgi:anti-anti-sigma regulatory factor